MRWIDWLRGPGEPETAPDGAPSWPVLPGFDYRYGVPVHPLAIEFIADLSEGQRVLVLGQIERLTFEALVRVDLEDLP